ncbi:MAG TPA: serine hydrolase [Dehalococcoidia bacterium]|nr:serine hydrolase [Dehalococcoidia bacterium]
MQTGMTPSAKTTFQGVNPRPSSRHTSFTFQGVARLGLGAIAWGLLILFGLTVAHLTWLVTLALVILGEGPASDDVLPVLLPIFIVITLVMAALVARFISSLPKVAAAIGVIFAIIWGIQTAGALKSSDWALYQARAIAWGESDVKDYQKFPQRPMANAASAFQFAKGQPLQLGTIEYKSGEKTKQADFETFLKSTNTTSFIVIKDGQIRYEGYFNGYSRDSIVTSFSVAKSFVSALTGVAISEGYIGSVDDKITIYLPELRGKGFDDVTIRHLLTMSSGVRYITNDEASFLRMITLRSEQTLAYYHPNLRARLLHDIEPDGRAAGARYKYNDYLPQLVGVILERTTQRPVSQYLEEKLWKALGTEFPASWSLDSNKSGFEQMQSGINARAIDFAKFGQLFLDSGVWGGKQLIAASWVKESTSPDPNDTRPWDLDDEGWKDAGGYYKYLWWGIPNADGTYDYVARGHLGQKIYVSPRDNAVIVRFGSNDGGVDKWEDVLADVIAALR